jgi:RHS repeat-associated protein
MVKETRIYAPQSQGGAMLRRTLTNWEQTSNTVQPSIPTLDNTTKTAYRNARPKEEVSIILDTGSEALAKTVTYAYDSADTNKALTVGLDLVTSTDSHFAGVDQTIAQSGAIATIPAGLPMSSAETVYLNDANYRDRNILGLATSIVVKDANNQVVGKTQSNYDEWALQSYGYNANDWTDPGAYRGNVTTVRRYIDASAGDVPLTNECPAGVCLDTHAYFDQLGNVWKVKNERGIESQTEYAGPAEYKHAYVTSALTAVPDPTGAHGSNAAFTSTSVYDQTTGLVTSTTDANNQITRFSYRDEQNTPDPMLRLRKVTRPDNSWTTYDYHDVAGDLYVETKSSIDATRSTTARQYFDKLGRSVRAFAYENTDAQAQWIGSDTYYDQLGRVSQGSNTYRTATPSGTLPSTCTVCTSSSYDALGRVKTVTLPDGTSAQTTYQGIYMTVTDQAGKQRRQKMNAQGRVVRVDEPDATGNLGSFDAPVQPTFYQYNTQGSLIEVSQGLTQAGLNPEDASNYLQHRYFKYDALSRLTYERQVEQNANTAFNVADPLTGNSQWSRKIAYDETINGVSYPGMVTSMMDARGVRTEYNYDNLNRIYKVTYSDGTPAVSNYYDQARTGYHNKGRLTEAQTSAVAASGQMPAIPQTSQVYDYDLMGRVAHQQQAVGTNSHTLSYGYNLGGQLTSQTYPSGRVVNYSFDDAARLASVTSGTQTYASQFDYSSPQGLLKAMTLGNGAIESYDYNNRLQVNSISLAKNGSTIQRYEYKYGKVNADGSVDESKNNGQVGRIESFVNTQKQWQQRFGYDSIGRLSTASEYRGDDSQQSYLINYQYDTFGNRYQSAASNPTTANPLPYAPVENNEIDQNTNRFISSQITYDAAGNILSDPRFTNQRYTYDANNRQRQVTTLITGDKGNPLYPPTTSVYDGAGQRVAQIYGGSVNQLFVYDASGKLVAEYGQAPIHQNAMISDDGGGTHYVFSDQQGSTRVVMDSQAIVAERHDYQPFGGEIYSDIGMRGNQGYGAGDGVRQKYAGMEKDEASGMSHTLWRKYDSISGRWTSPDPYGGSMSVSDPQSFNRYTYVQNDPVNLVDPSGLAPNIGYYYREADLGWGQVSGSYWGRPNPFDFSHNGHELEKNQFREQRAFYQYGFVMHSKVDPNYERVQIIVSEIVVETIDITSGAVVSVAGCRADAAAIDYQGKHTVSSDRLRVIEETTETIVSVSRQEGIDPRYSLAIAAEESFLGAGNPGSMAAANRNKPAMGFNVNPMQLHEASSIAPSATDQLFNIRGALHDLKSKGYGSGIPDDWLLALYGGGHKIYDKQKNWIGVRPNYRVALTEQLEYLNQMKNSTQRIPIP